MDKCWHRRGLTAGSGYLFGVYALSAIMMHPNYMIVIYAGIMKVCRDTEASKPRSRKMMYGKDFQTMEDNGIIARLSRKLTKAQKMNCDLRKYAVHKEDCFRETWYKEGDTGCTCGLEELMNPKRQEPV